MYSHSPSLDDYQTFRRVYEVPIVKSRTPEATAKELEIGEGRLAQLLTISNSFVLRRDAGLLGNYLPPKRQSTSSTSQPSSI